MNKWITYQKERFPVPQYALMALAFSYSGLCLSMALRGAPGLPGVQAVVTAAVTTFLFFLELHIADEFKDYEDDCRYQPYRPVPRGLVSLKELGVVGVLALIIQIVITASFSVGLFPILAAAGAYLGLMSVEFFAREQLRRRPLLYMLTHMLILLFIDLYVTACDWLVHGGVMPPALVLFLGISFANGIAIELGRKFRAPKDEEPGVDTYTSAWGIKTASLAWITTLSCSAVVACLIDIHAAAAIVALLAAAAVAVFRFNSQPTTIRAKRLELISSVWVFSIYLSLGTIPAIARSLTQCMH